MKGQIFLIAALLIIALIVIIKNMTGTAALGEEQRFQNLELLGSQLRNVEEEFAQIAGVAALQGDASTAGMQFLSGFSRQVRSDQDSSILFLYVVLNGSTQRYNVTVGNFLNDRMNVTMNATSAAPNGTQAILNDREMFSSQFNATSNVTTTITLTYVTRAQEITERVTMPIGTNNTILLFTDISLRSNEFMVRSKEIFVWSGR